MKKDDFKQRTHKILDELVEHIEKLEQKVDDIAEDAKEEYSEQLEKLKGIRDNLSTKLDEYEKIADSKWDIVKERAGNFFEDISKSWKDNFTNVSDVFRKENKDHEDDSEPKTNSEFTDETDDLSDTM